MSQAEEATRLDLPLYAYSNIECGRIDPSEYGVKAPKIGKIKPLEMAILLRRRKGWTQVQLAEKMKRCRFQINQMELGKASAEPLLKYWGLSK